MLVVIQSSFPFSYCWNCCNRARMYVNKMCGGTGDIVLKMAAITFKDLVRDCAQKFAKSFWSPDIWLPTGYNWEELESNEEISYPKFYDLGYALAFAVLFVFLRMILESYFFTPYGIACGLKPAATIKKLGVSNDALEKMEKAYSKCKKKLDEVVVGEIAKELGWSEQRVAKYIHVRKMAKPTALQKFSESAWRFTYYTFAFLFGVWVLKDKDWLWDINKCWDNFPLQSITADVWWYYILSLSFYVSLMFSVLSDTRRKDFVEMFLHHLVTIVLLSLSWTCNMVRTGSLVLVIHDVADIFIESAKMTNYVDKKRLSNWIIHIFAIVWVISRLVIYPFWVVDNTLFGALEFAPSVYPVYYIFNAMLCTLMVLHIIWTYFICKVLIRIWLGKGTKDSRSDSEDSDDEDTSRSSEKKKLN